LGPLISFELLEPVLDEDDPGLHAWVIPDGPDQKETLIVGGVVCVPEGVADRLP
jgi:hypothetical protein